MWPWLKRLFGEDPEPSKPVAPPPAALDPGAVIEAKQRALAAIKVPYEKAQAESQDRFWNDGQRGNVKRFSAKAFGSAQSILQNEVPAPGDTPQSYLARVSKLVRDMRDNGPDLDEESWYDSAVDEAAALISSAVEVPPPPAPPAPPPMHWARRLTRADLVEGRVYAHGTTRLNLAESDLTSFVDPPDAGLMFGYRALTAGDPFEKSFVVWMATMRRRAGNDAVIESLQRVMTQLADEGSLQRLLQESVTQARVFGYEKLWLVPALFKEPLLAPELKITSEWLGKPLMVVPTSGMVALQLKA